MLWKIRSYVSWSPEAGRFTSIRTVRPTDCLPLPVVPLPEEMISDELEWPLAAFVSLLSAVGGFVFLIVVLDFDAGTPA